MRKKILFLILIAVLSMNALYHFGRPLWTPYYLKLAGKDSVSDIMTRYETEVSARMADDLERLNVSTYPDQLMIIALKKPQQLELWGEYDGIYRLIKSYEFKGFSGELGPKLVEGDGQIPEGIYGIEYLNPNSSFHLSMKLNYPNAFDRKMAKRDGRTTLGDDIMIHGKSATIGCIPIGDKGIEELFVWVHRVGISNTRSLISPVDFRSETVDPQIDGIDWESQLYRQLENELKKFVVTPE